MPKYYCKNGEYQIILNADSVQSALRKTLDKMIDAEKDCCCISIVSERGFSLGNGSKLVSMIPFLKEQEIDLPPDEMLVKEACRFMGLDPKGLTPDKIDWILNGEEEGGEKV